MRRFSIIFFVLLILPFLVLYFKSPHFYMTHDGRYHIERTFYFVESIKEGNLFPSWTRFYNNGFGSPIFVFLFPVPYLISSFLYIIGFNLITTVKLTFLFFLGVSIASIYLLLRKGFLLKQESAIFGCLLFVFSPYTISQIFVRGSLRELAGMSVFPLAILGIIRLFDKISKRNIGLLGLISGLFFLTDGLSVALFSSLLVSFIFYYIVRTKNRLKLFLSYLLSLSLGLMTASYIFLPFFKESKYLKLNIGYFYWDHFVYLWQYFDPHWGFGFSFQGPNDGMSFQLGILNLFVFAIYIYLLFKKRIKLNLFYGILLINLFVILTLITYSPLSLFIWEKVTILRNIQLAWRLLAPVIFILTIIGAFVLNYFKVTKKALIILYFLTLIVSFKYLRTNQIVVYEQKDLVNNSSDATAFHEFIPIFRENITIDQVKNKVEFSTGSGSVSEIVEKNNSISFWILAQTNATIKINTLYFPGWAARVDGVKTGITVTESKIKTDPNDPDVSGLMEISVSPGKHKVILSFEDTNIRKQGKLLSLIGLIATFILII